MKIFVLSTYSKTSGVRCIKTKELGNLKLVCSVIVVKKVIKKARELSMIK